ncbi:MAG: radical SAM family heme chaperone HemW [Lachnospiraceae bacterium]|nr:radical SAM family heme chaperone HemW [Lachnospiraceae bacterium]
MELYIHIPFCIQKCKYCDFLSGPYDIEMRHAYTDALCREILSVKDEFFHEKLSSIYIGGGTPTWLEVAYMQQIMDTVHAVFDFADDCEVTMECNPGTAGLEAFRIYRDMGVNRLSIGLQSAHAEELECLGRIHTFEKFLRTFEAARKADFSNISVDIMSALPHQTPEKLIQTIQAVTRIRPEHISCYALMIEEGTEFYDLYHEDVVRRDKGLDTLDLPDSDMEYRLYKIAQKELEDRRYHRYEISNFCQEGKECRHNIGYWKRIPYLGVGVGAASLLKEVRYSNERDIYEYIKKIGNRQSVHVSEEPISKQEAMEEYMYLGLRMTDGITRDEFFKEFHITVEAVFGSVLEKLEKKKMIRQYGGRIFLTDTGMDISNQVLSEFIV